nr:hypothetical protein [uncultured Undibacterium sp.]
MAFNLKKNKVIKTRIFIGLSFLCSLLTFTGAFGQSKYIEPRVRAINGHVSSANPDTKNTQLESVRLYALDSREKIGVFHVPEIGLVSVRVGELIPGIKAVISKITDDKAVLEDLSAGGADKQVVWMYRAKGKNGRQLERFRKNVSPELYLLPPKKVFTSEHESVQTNSNSAKIESLGNALKQK